MNKLTAFLLILSTGLAAYGMDDAEIKIIKKITEDIKKEYKAEEPWEEINSIAQKAIKDCGITKPVTILQTHNTYNAWTTSRPRIHPQEFMIIGTDLTEEAITYTVYHELGHIANGDVEIKQKLSNDQSKWFAKGLSAFAGIGATFALNSRIKKPIASTIVGGITSFATMLTGTMFSLYKERTKEHNADIFAYENLIKHGHLSIAMCMISDYLYRHEFEFKSLPIAICDHPHNFERAKIGLEILHKNGINIAHLIKNLPHDLNTGVKEHFPDQVQRFFPEFCVEKPEELK